MNEPLTNLTIDQAQAEGICKFCGTPDDYCRHRFRSLNYRGVKPGNCGLLQWQVEEIRNVYRDELRKMKGKRK